MPTFLFDKIIFGPVTSRRLGESLGINLLPTNKKVCNFDCIYCECGLTDSTVGDLPSRSEVANNLKYFLEASIAQEKSIDAITFAGNGEPTMHADFVGIIDDTYELRNRLYPNAQIALLTNATTIASKKIRTSFEKIDQVMLKLDSVHKTTVDLLNCPLGNYNLDRIIELLAEMQNPIIQTMFVKGTYKGQVVDNTTDEEIIPWLDALKRINPALVMIYTIARDTPFETLEKVSFQDLSKIGEKVEALGFEVQISG
jgi:wyosine [tRNA(Phe)-imidazoG37] synthetase (radical SAM superfamily)